MHALKPLISNHVRPFSTSLNLVKIYNCISLSTYLQLFMFSLFGCFESMLCIVI